MSEYDDWSEPADGADMGAPEDYEASRDGIGQLVKEIRDLRRIVNALTRQAPMQAAGIGLDEDGMTIGSSLTVDGDLTSTGNASFGGDIESTGDATFGGNVDIAGTADVTGQLNITTAGGLWAKYADGATGARLGPLRTFAGDPDGFGIHIQDQTSGAQADIFKARIDGAGLKRIQIGQSGGPVETFWGLAKDVYLESTRVGSGTDSSMWLHSAGAVRLTSGTYTLTIPWDTSSSAANMFLDGNGRIWKSSSARKYKQDIEDADVDVAAVLRMRPRTWRDRGEVERDPSCSARHVGFIAEELDEIGLGQFVTRTPEGEVEGIAYDRLVAAIIPVLRELDARITRLESPK